jgi:hypothetical protein
VTDQEKDTYAYLTDVFGPDASAGAEHKRGDQVRYTLPGEPGELAGVIVWIMEASNIAEGLRGLRYVVDREGAGAGSIPDIVFPARIRA